MVKRLILFLVLNFLALAIGSYFTGVGVDSAWYESLAKAPWSPPGWLFGVAWTIIMICFAIFMALALPLVVPRSKLIALYMLQWILNVAWNPVFFGLQMPYFALIIIAVLTLVVSTFFFGFTTKVKWKSLLVLPYFLWLLIATSLNAYIVYFN